MLQDHKLIRNKIGLLNLAEELGNVSRACKVMGYSRDTFYRYRLLKEDGGVENLIERTRRKPNIKNRVDDANEQAVLTMALEHPARGQTRVSNELRKLGTFVSPSVVRSIWLRHGYLGSQDTFYVGTLKGVGRIYQQTFVDTYSKTAFGKLYNTKTPITAADLLNDRVLPFFDAHNVPLLRMLTDRGTKFCGRLETHDYELYLGVNEIEHTKTKVHHPQTNGICERFHKTVLQEFYQVAFRRKLYASIEELQRDLDEWLEEYNQQRTHQGKMCCGRTPYATFVDGIELYKQKQLDVA